MKRALLIFICCSAAFAQEANSKPDLVRLTDELDAAIQSGDLNKAAELSKMLKQATIVARDQSMAKGGAALADQILTWLPPDTETFVVAQQPFAVPGEDQQQLESATAGAQAFVLGLVGAAEKESVIKLLRGRTIRLAAIGARKFHNHEPIGPQHNIIPFGMIAYEGCSVASFTEPLPESIFQRPADESVMGQPVWISKGSQSDATDSDTYLAALPKPDLLLVCNDRDFFSTMVSRMASPPSPRALPPDLPEWKQLDRSVPVWGIRHYRADHADGDPSIPGPRSMIAPSDKDPQATGIVVEFRSPPAGARARMLAKSDPWAGLTNAVEPQGGAKSQKSPSQKSADGVWEFSIPNTPDGRSSAVLSLMSFLGFVVVI